MKYILLVFVAVATACAQTNVVTKVRVTGDNVSLRAKPDLQGELLERAMLGEELIYCGETNGWVAVQAPVSVDCWVSGDYVKDGAVDAKKLNVRSGPSLNYSIVGVLSRGDAVAVRDEFNNWLKIAPPDGCSVWISGDYVEKIEPPKPEAIPEPEPEPEPADEVGAVEEKLPPLVLDELDASKPQGREKRVSGVLRRANPGLYKLVLVNENLEETLCLVRGRESQMERLLSWRVSIEGKVYWAKSVDLPVIVPSKIYLDPILSE